MPERFSRIRVVRDDVAGAVSSEYQLPRCRQHAASASRAPFVLESPRGLARFVVERGQEASARPGARFQLAAKAHRSVRICVEQIKDRINIVLADIEEARLRRKRGWLPADGAALAA